MNECEDYSNLTSLYTDLMEVEGSNNTIFTCEPFCFESPDLYLNVEGVCVSSCESGTYEF